MMETHLVRRTCPGCWGHGWIIGTITSHRDLCWLCLGKGVVWGLPQ